jgi:hypothetical protein
MALCSFALPGLQPAFAQKPSSSAGVPGSGDGALRFRVLYGRERLPEQAQTVLESAHGGFAVDRRPGRGEIYFALAGAGIVRIAQDLQTIELLDTAAPVRDTNLHNTTLWQTAAGVPYLSFPANDAGRVFTTTLDGELVHTLLPPSMHHDLGQTAVNDYFRDGGDFVPTDVDQLAGLFYVTTGYSELDWVLTARLTAKPADAVTAEPFEMVWNGLSFGGRGNGAGQFGTGHGVTVVQGDDGSSHLDIADRPNAEIDRFSPAGRYLETVRLPAGAFPCDIDYHGRLGVVGALHGPDREKGAPIYVLEDDRVVSEIWPKEELGLDKFQHIHNAVLTEVGGRFYIVVQAWNPGDFAVLEQVPAVD